MRTKLRALTLALAVTTLTAGGANAAIQLRSYSFTAATAGPVTSHSGSFVLAYDDVADAVSLSSIVFSVGATAFNLTNASAFADGLDNFAIGGLAFGVFGVSSSVEDFYLSSQYGFIYALPKIGIFGGPVTLTRTDVAAVPEPSAWALMILGFGSAGAALRRRRPVLA